MTNLTKQVTPYITRYASAGEYVELNNFTSTQDLRNEISDGDLIKVSTDANDLVPGLLTLANQPKVKEQVEADWHEPDYSQYPMGSDSWLIDYLLNDYATGMVFIPEWGYYLAMDA